MLRRQVLRTRPRLSMLLTTTTILHFVYFLVSLLFCEKHITGHPANCHEGTEVQYSSTVSLASTIDWSRWRKPRPVRFNPGSDPVPIIWKDGTVPVSVWTGVSRRLSEFDLRTAQPVTSRYASPPLWYMIYLLTAIGLTPGGSSTVHIYTQTIRRTTQITTNLEECGTWPVFASFTLAFALQLTKKHG